MPDFLELLERISFLAAMPTVAGVFITAALLVISRDWRASVFALIVQYLLVGLLLTRLIRPEVAIVKVLIGALICLVFFVTGRRTSQLATSGPAKASAQVPPRRRWQLPAEVSFRLLAMLLVTVAAYSAASRFPLPQVPSYISLACYLLGGLGLLMVGMTEEPLRAGMGLLTFLLGFDLFYSALEPSLVVTGLLGAASLLIGLAMAYLAVAQVGGAEGGG